MFYIERSLTKRIPFTLEVEENSINECERQYEGKKCQCVVSEILIMPKKALNFPDEDDRYVHVQFENTQTTVTFINTKLTESIVCSFNLNRFQTTENGNYQHINLYHFRPQTDGVMRRFHFNQITSLKKIKCTFLNLRKEPLLFKDENLRQYLSFRFNPWCVKKTMSYIKANSRRIQLKCPFETSSYHDEIQHLQTSQQQLKQYNNHLYQQLWKEEGEKKIDE